MGDNLIGMKGIENRLGEWRRKRGTSAADLAARAGVTRQTIYAIEAGTYVPNTAVALRLARALDASVEDLFVLGAEETRTEPVAALKGSEAVGQVVQLCRVDERLVAAAPAPVNCWLPVSDGIVEKPGRVRVFPTDSDFSNRILIAGCDPGSSVLARHARAAGIESVLVHRNSTQALALLKEGYVHVAGTHLKEPPADKTLAVISFAVWEEGIVTAPGNPKGIAGIEDFPRADVTIVNREKGSGSRALLDARLKALGISSRNIHGYDHCAPGHLPAAWFVHSGSADCCLATRAAARVFGLNFISLVSERYDLAVHRRHLELPRVQNLFETLGRSGFRRELEGLGGYDTTVSGRRVL
jgi:molybdate-binding protein/DNA-binding XRE family transcriptional regulator